MGDVLSILGLSLFAMFNPTLLAAVAILMLLPGTKRLMFGYLLGAYLTSIGAGLVVVYTLHGRGSVETTKQTLSPLEDLLFGAIALIAAWALLSGRAEAAQERRAERKAAKQRKGEPQALAAGTAAGTRVGPGRLRGRGAAELPRRLLPGGAGQDVEARLVDGRGRGRGRRLLPDPAAAARGAAARLRRWRRSAPRSGSNASASGSPPTAAAPAAGCCLVIGALLLVRGVIELLVA